MKFTNKLVILICCCAVFLVACSDNKPQEQPPPPQVTVVRTVAQKVPLYQEFVGQTQGFKDIAIQARVEGFLEGIFFEEGTQVKAGDLLYTLESQPFEEQVIAKMSRVAEAKTMLAKAKGDLERIRPLAATKAVSQSDLDTAEAVYEAAGAALQATQADLRAARIQLGYTKIHSPIDGIIGKTQAKVGDLVGSGPDSATLNVVSQIDPILVQFFITESQYLQVIRRYTAQSPGNGTAESRQSLELILIDGSVYEHTGKFDFIGREVDPASGAILVQASFANPDQILRPGQFAKVKAQSDIIEKAILVPQRCVSELQGTYSVFVVSPDNKVQRRQIQVGPKMGAFWLVTDGLQPGERVVYEGLQRVDEESIVKPIEKEIESINNEGK